MLAKEITREISSYLQRSEMDHAVDIWMLFECPVKVFLLANVDLGKVWSFAAYQLNAIEGFLRGIVEIVGDDNLVPRLKQCESGEGTNVPSAPE